jgi:hypothetical protein
LPPKSQLDKGKAIQLMRKEDIALAAARYKLLKESAK